MPRSKRNKVVSLTKTTGKGRDHKTKLIESVRNAVDEYKNVYVFSFENLRESKLTEIRAHWRESRLFLGKNTVSQIALGRNPEEEFKDNLRHVSKSLVGNVGLLFTDRKKDEVVKYFKGFTSPEYAKSGAILNENITLEPGLLSFAAPLLDQFRKLGLVVEVDNGFLHLKEKFVAAKKGVPLTPEQAKVLAHFDKKTVNFTIELKCHWSDGEFEEL